VATRVYNAPMVPADVLTAVVARLSRELAPPRRRHRPLYVDDGIAGWVDDARADRLARCRDTFDVRSDRIEFVTGIDDAPSRSLAMERLARTLAAEGRLSTWRNERYAIAPDIGAAPWFLLERAAARYFGVRTYAAHVNGLVRRGDDAAMWIARRSATKPIDPGLLDNLVGGGIGAGRSVADTMVKEAWEEAGVDARLAARAVPAGSVHLCREQTDGLQRETIFVHDLWLPATFVPACQDGEAVEHRLMPMRELAALVARDAGPDVVTADASLVIVDCLLRQRAIAPDATGRTELEALGRPGASAVCAIGG
jgi:8-oxo-dGTP pyrophosphatase MutT (NUDIX family)